MTNKDGKTDVFIVGGGPGGLAAAIAIRKIGFEVTVADVDHPPIDKACGEGLLPDSVDALADLGVALHACDGHALRGIRFFDDEAAPQADFPAGPGRGIRRKALHQKLLDRAAACGVSLLWRARVTALDNEGVFLDGARVRARWVVGADGANSSVRRWSGLDRPVRGVQRFAYRRHYRVHPWTDCVEIYWHRGLQAYVTPVSPLEVCTAVISRDSRMRLSAALAALPALAGRLANATPTSAERGGVTFTLRLPRVCRDRVALIGDASGCVDAITGEGLGLAFNQASVLADAIAANDLSRYETAHRQIMRRASMMAKLLLALDRRPALRQRVTRTFARHTQLFSHFVAAHVGARNEAELLAAGASLGWHMLAL